jgi:uncharacterized membrane protein
MREHRTADVQLRLADAITRSAGSMRFVWLHAIAFAVWMLVVESSPWPTLTLVVPLEAIFLSTFVMIGQNRQAAFAREGQGDHDFAAETLELRRNTELTREVHRLTVEGSLDWIRRHDLVAFPADHLRGGPPGCSTAAAAA